MQDPFGIGVSILEISHRNDFYGELNEQTLQLLRKVFQIPSSHEVLMSAVGAQHHFGLLVQHLSLPGDVVLMPTQENGLIH